MFKQRNPMFKKRKKTPEGLTPWMDAVELSQLIAIFEALQPRCVLEWGSGGSTKALLERCPFIERMISVEHVPEWALRVQAELDDPRLELHLVEPDLPMAPGPHSREEIHAWGASAETDPAVMASYVARPRSLGATFELVLVDGRARTLCLAQGWELLDPGGVIVLHDAQRTQYHTALHRLGRVAFLEPWGGGQLALVKKRRGK